MARIVLDLPADVIKLIDHAKIELGLRTRGEVVRRIVLDAFDKGVVFESWGPALRAIDEGNP